MPRNYGTISTHIWKDATFRRVSHDGQWLLLMLATQPDISAAGVLSLTVRRWAQSTADMSREAIGRAISELIEAGYVAADRDTEELAVLPFVRWDNGYRNSKRRSVIVSDFHAVASAELRRRLATELDHVGIGVGPSVDGASDGAPDAPSDRASDGASDENLGRGHSEPSTYDAVSSLSDKATQGAAGRAANPKSQVDGPSHRASDAPSDALWDAPSGGASPRARASLIPHPHPSSHGTLTGSAATSAAEEPTPLLSGKALNKKAQELARLYAEREPMCKFPAVMAEAKRALRASRWSPEEIGEALCRMANEGRSVTTDGLRYELDGFPGRRPERKQTTDDKIARFAQQFAVASSDDVVDAEVVDAGREED